MLWVTTSSAGKTSSYRISDEFLLESYLAISDFSCTHGSEPQELTLGTDGNYYGVTSSGGSRDSGTVFQLTPSGSLTVLLNFTAEG